ncbi:MurR/RpiR family transcriptional regulator [Tatumella sp. TA1]|uniref:MurR/RpiR family transcriptional regulator n=1 Tax=Rosenbergiella collisarenosi TaxID=1544695 RepID=UPI0008F7EB4C|nr:MurR/RpiR family transcriptional regulator [Rosenbergiella collisarenosi]MBT0720320.1 MurR/RpiR family transcriptional regulator [Rosenbergiella collisarenosi]QGX91975.1 MurR/RpiR family transcriptional regulator [Tatumella sp. TA1]
MSMRHDLFSERLRARIDSLSSGLQQVLLYIDQHRALVIESTALEIAAATQTSDATVVRAIQAIGFSGLRELKSVLEQWFDPPLNSADKMDTTLSHLAEDVNQSIDYVVEGHLTAVQTLRSGENRQAIAQAVSLLVNARQLAIFGINASGILAEYAARLFHRNGLPTLPLNRSGIGLAEQLLSLQRGDVLIMMAQKSAHREGMTTLREAQRLGVPVILLTSAKESKFVQQADVVIHVPRGTEQSNMPLHGPVLACLEILVVATAASMSQRAVKSMKRLQELHRGLKNTASKK